MFLPQEPHPSWGEYHFIVTCDQGKLVMEGKDYPIDNNWKQRSPTQLGLHTKTSALVMLMTEPVHYTGKIVAMCSVFCIAATTFEIHSIGIYCELLIKRIDKDWSKQVPGEEIDNHFKEKQPSYFETYKQAMNGKGFLIQ